MKMRCLFWRSMHNGTSSCYYGWLLQLLYTSKVYSSKRVYSPAYMISASQADEKGPMAQSSGFPFTDDMFYALLGNVLYGSEKFAECKLQP